MADQDDVRRLALELPEVTENDDRFAFSIGKKGIAWVWLERSAPKAPRVPNAWRIQAPKALVKQHPEF